MSQPSSDNTMAGPPNAFPWRVALGLLGVFFVVCVGMCVNSLYSLRDTTRRGPLTAKGAWPEPVRDLHDALITAGANVNSFEVCLVDGQPGSTLSTVICRLADDPRALQSLVEHLELRPVNESYTHAISSRVEELELSAWWPQQPRNCEYFASRRLVEGEEADLYVVARDNSRQLIFIHYNFNF